MLKNFFLYIKLSSGGDSTTGDIYGLDNQNIAKDTTDPRVEFILPK